MFPEGGRRAKDDKESDAGCVARHEEVESGLGTRDTHVRMVRHKVVRRVIRSKLLKERAGKLKDSRLVVRHGRRRGMTDGAYASRTKAMVNRVMSQRS